MVFWERSLFTDDDHTQEEIGDKLGWGRSKVSQYTTLLSNVATDVLDMARSYQTGRVATDATNVANETATHTFNFTEGWFRTSGIYDLTETWETDGEEKHAQIVNEFEEMVSIEEERAKGAGGGVW